MNSGFFADFDLLLDFDFLLDFFPLLCFNFRGKTFALDVVARFVTARTQTTSGNFMMMIWWEIADVYGTGVSTTSSKEGDREELRRDKRGESGTST